MIGMYRPKSIIIVRHAEYWWNVLYHLDFDLAHPRCQEALQYIVGVEEQHVPLTPAGYEQARLTGSRLAEEYPKGFDAIFYSPWDRVMQTRDQLLLGWDESTAHNMRARMSQSQKLAEQYQGDGVQYLDPKHPEHWHKQYERMQLLLAKKHRDYTQFRRKGIGCMNGGGFDPSMTGESAWEVSIRTGKFLQRLFQKHYHNKRVLVMTHLAVIMWLRSNLMNLTPKDIVDDLNSGRKPISNCGVFHFDYERDVRDEETGKLRDQWVEKRWNQLCYDGAVLEQ